MNTEPKRTNTLGILIVILIGILILCVGMPLFINATTNNESPNDSVNALDNCMFQAEQGYHSRWNGTCEAQGDEKECSLPHETAKSYEDILYREKQLCIQIHK
jgi:hypothetical protein